MRIYDNFSILLVTDFHSDPEPDYPDGYAVWEDSLLQERLFQCGVGGVDLVDIRDAEQYISDWSSPTLPAVLIRNVWPDQDLLPAIDATQAAAEDRDFFMAQPLVSGQDKYREDKTYLARLWHENQGDMAVPETYVSGKHMVGKLDRLNFEQGIVIKPIDGFSAHGVSAIHSPHDRNFRKIFEDGKHIVQPFMSDIEHECSYYFVDNEFIYATRSKGFGFDDKGEPIFDLRWTVNEFTPSDTQLALAQKFQKQASLPHGLVRVDMAERSSGENTIMELETFSPILSFDCISEESQRKITRSIAQSVYSNMPQAT